MQMPNFTHLSRAKHLRERHHRLRFEALQSAQIRN